MEGKAHWKVGINALFRGFMEKKAKIILKLFFWAAFTLLAIGVYNNNFSTLEDKLEDVQSSLDDIQSSIEQLSVDVDEVKTKCDELEFELRWK